jgi:hypothetical protein
MEITLEGVATLIMAITGAVALVLKHRRRK